MSLLDLILLLAQAVPALFFLLIVVGLVFNRRRARRIMRERGRSSDVESDGSTGREKVHRSKVGTGYLTFVLATAGAAAVVGYRGLLATGSAGDPDDTILFIVKVMFWMLLVVGCVAPFGLLIFVWLGITYTVTGRELRITVGPCRRMMNEMELRPPGASVIDLSVMLRSITEIAPTYNPIAAPALSMDRLKVRYRSERGTNEWVIISPEDPEEFIRDVAGQTPGMVLLAPRRAVRREGNPDVRYV